MNFQEVNHVLYDPAEVTIEKMVEWLKKAGTYQKTLKPLIKELDHE